MFDPGKVLKVKVEVAPGSFGYGRATIVDRLGSQLILQVKTTKDGNKLFPKGTRLWFTNDSPKVTFNGMWAASIVGTQLMGGKTLMVCSAPKHEPLTQKRNWPRVSIELPVKLTRAGKNYDCNTADISRSGLTLELGEEGAAGIESGEELALVIQSKDLNIAVNARVIRVDRHWIANKTVLGLEFLNLQPPGQEELDRLLVPLGGRPRNPELEERAKQAMGSGMASWSKTIKTDERDKPSPYALFEDDESDEDNKLDNKIDQQEH